MSTSEIYNYCLVNDLLVTAGQPTEAQLRAAAQEGFTTVINLATLGKPDSLPDEAGLVRELGMTYYHIPVKWGEPLISDFEKFEQAMLTLLARKTLLHCAANYRATAFYGLFAIKHLGWTETQMEEFRAQIWHASDYPVWEDFIRAMKTRIAAQ